MTADTASRKKLSDEPDEFLSLSQRAWHWADENRGKAIGVAGAAAALLLAGVLAAGLVERSRAERAQELAGAVEGYLGGDAAAAAAPLAALADRLGSSPQGAVARYFAAGAHAAAGDTERAAAAYEQAAAQAGREGALAGLARLGGAYLALEGGDEAAAEREFRALLAQDAAVVPRGALRLELAGIAERQGRAEEARRLLEQVVADDPDGPLGAAARQRLGSAAGDGEPAA